MSSVADIDTHPAVSRVRNALAEGGATGTIRVLDTPAPTAAAAAQALGIEVGQIANSLVFMARTGEDSEPVLILASGAHRVDLQLVADAFGVDAITRAKPDLVREATGFAIGGVSPVGHLTPLPTVVDAALADYDVVYAAAGHPHTVFDTSYEELLRLTGGRSAVLKSS